MSPGYPTIVVITVRESDDLVELLTRLKRTGFAVTVLLITQRSPYRSASLLPAIGVQVHHVWRESDLEPGLDGGVTRKATALGR